MTKVLFFLLLSLHLDPPFPAAVGPDSVVDPPPQALHLEEPHTGFMLCCYCFKFLIISQEAPDFHCALGSNTSSIAGPGESKYSHVSHLESNIFMKPAPHWLVSSSLPDQSLKIELYSFLRILTTFLLHTPRVSGGQSALLF